MDFFKRFFPCGLPFKSVPTETLYDLLGARPDDDAEALRQAFRKAAKAHHPDLHASDPDAPLRFRRIVAANAILRDAKQRATYDRLLQFKRKQLQARRTRTIVSNAIVATVVALLISGYEFLAPVPTAAIEKVVENAHSATASTAIKQPTGIGTVAVPVKADLNDTGGSVEIAVLQSRIDTTVRDGQRVAHSGAEARDGVTTQSAVSPAKNSRNAEAIADALWSDLAKFHREQGIGFYVNGDFHRAIAALDRAIRLDPNDTQAFSIRARALDELGAFEHALAGHDQEIHIKPSDIYRERHTHTRLAATKTHFAHLKRLSQFEHHFGRLSHARRIHRANLCRCEKNLHAVVTPEWSANKSYAPHISEHTLRRPLVRTRQS